MSEIKNRYIDDSADSMLYIMDDIKCCYNYTDYEKQLELYERFVNGKNKEEKEMRNEVLELWHERKMDKIFDKYRELEKVYIENQYGVVESFNELVDKFNNDLEELYKFDKVTEQFGLKENAPTTVLKYVIDDDKLHEEATNYYKEEREEEIKKLNETYKEVTAQLSMSDDLKYQQEVLQNYGIITKKTKKISG